MNKETKYVKTADCKNNWVLVDVNGETLGRVASRIALILQGKNKPTYTPNVDNGDYVVVTNAANIVLTGKKAETMHYNYYTGFISGLRQPTFAEVIKKNPEKVIEHAVQRMLPKGVLGRKMLKKLKVYGGAEHPHTAQAPEAIKI